MYSVAIIDDNPLILESLCKTIPWKALDCDVIGTLLSGEEGYNFCIVHNPDIIITDIKMPGMSGLALIEKLQIEKIIFKSIIITGFDEFEFARQALLLGAEDIILKPFENTEMIAAVTKAISKNTDLSLSNDIQTLRSSENKHFRPLDMKLHYTVAVRHAFEYMQEHLNSRINLVELADYVGLSSAHLSRLMKKETGMSYMDIYNQMRIEKAIKLIQNGQYKIYEISNMVGIDNYAYFYQLFKKTTGKSPKEYQ